MITWVYQMIAWVYQVITLTYQTITSHYHLISTPCAENLHSIEAVVRPENTPSRKLVERHGFVQEGFFRENIFFNGRYLDSVVYSRVSR